MSMHKSAEKCLKRQSHQQLTACLDTESNPLGTYPLTQSQMVWSVQKRVSCLKSAAMNELFAHIPNLSAF